MGITNKRIQKVKEYLESINLDGMYVTNLTNVRYLTGFTGSAGSVLILQDTHSELEAEIKSIHKLRTATAIKIEEAASHGDLKENYEYKAAKEQM